MNLGQIRGFIKSQIGETTASNDALINSYINWGYHEIASRRDWDWLKEVGASITTTSGIEEYTLASDTHRIMGNLRDTTNERYIQEFSYRQFVKLYPNVGSTDTGSPLYWYPTELDSNGNQLIKFYPVPNATLTIKYDYVKRITDLSVDADTPIVPTRYHRLLIDYGLARWYEKEREYTDSGYFNAKFENELRQMLSDMVAESDNESMMESTSRNYSGNTYVQDYFINL